MITRREFYALLIAGVWDFIQVIALTWINELLAVLINTYLDAFDFLNFALLIEPLTFCSGQVLISIILARMLGFHWALLPVFVLENIAIVKWLPSTTAGAFLIVRRNHKLAKKEFADN